MDEYNRGFRGDNGYDGMERPPPVSEAGIAPVQGGPDYQFDERLYNEPNQFYDQRGYQQTDPEFYNQGYGGDGFGNINQQEYYGAVQPVAPPVVQGSVQPPTPTSPPHVEGLSTLVEYLAPETQDAALQWCVDTDTPSVQVLLLSGQEEAFLAALGVQPGGNVDTILRDRLASQRRALGAKGFDNRPAVPVPPPQPAVRAPPQPGGYGGYDGYDGYAASDVYGVGVPYAPPTEFRGDGLNHREYHN